MIDSFCESTFFRQIQFVQIFWNGVNNDVFLHRFPGWAAQLDLCLGHHHVAILRGKGVLCLLMWSCPVVWSHVSQNGVKLRHYLHRFQGQTDVVHIIWFRINVLDGTKCIQGGVLFRRNVLGGTKQQIRLSPEQNREGRTEMLRFFRVNVKSRLIKLVLLPLWYGNKDIIRDTLS